MPAREPGKNVDALTASENGPTVAEVYETGEGEASFGLEVCQRFVIGDAV